MDCLLGQTFLLSVKLSMSFLRRKSQLNSRQSCNQLSKRIFSHFPPAFRYRCVWMSDGLARQASWPTPPCLGTHSLFYLMSCVGVWMCVPPPNTNTHSYMHAQAFTETLSFPWIPPPPLKADIPSNSLRPVKQVILLSNRLKASF